MRPNVWMLPATVTLALLCSCGTGSDAVAEQQRTTSEPPVATTSAPAEPEMQEQPPSGPYDLVPRSVRARPHDGGTRVVITFDGKGTPGWAARYVDEAVLEGSGDVWEMDGEAILRLDISGTPTLPDDDGTVREQVGGDVVDLHTVGAWEGVMQVFIGLGDGQNEFRTSTMAEPSRIVVDVLSS